MSFSLSVKQDLMEISMKSSCCRRALLYGALLGAEVRENAVFFSTEYEEISIYMTKLIREFFKQEPALDYKIYVGRPRYTLWFESTKLISYLRAVEKSEEGLLELLGKSCVSCAQALLRGVFLAFGTVSDPTNSYHAEFLVPSAARAEKLDAFLAELGLSARKISRGNKIGLYYKSSSAIEELFAEMGGSRAVLTWSTPRSSEKYVITRTVPPIVTREILPERLTRRKSRLPQLSSLRIAVCLTVLRKI